MKLLTIAAVVLLVVSAWFGHKMRYTDSFEYERASQDAPCGPVLVQLLPTVHLHDSGVTAHTINKGPYALMICCAQRFKIDSVSELFVGRASDPKSALAIAVVEAPDKARVPTPWYFRLRDPIDLEYVDTTVALKLVVQDKAGVKQEQPVKVVLKTHRLSGWSNDFVSGLLSE